MGRNTKIFLVCSVLAMMAVAGCKHKENEGGVLYQVGNGAITEDDAVMVGESFPEAVQYQYMDRSGRQLLLDNMVSLELLYQEALKQKLDQDPMIKFQLDRARKNYLAQEVVERSLKVEDLYSFYQENFIRLDAVRIIIKAPGADDDKNAARATVNALYESLKNGEDFHQMKLRNNPEQKQDYGYFSRSAVIKQFGPDVATTLFSMDQANKQKFSTPFVVNSSFYIFYVVEYPQNLDPKGYDMVWEEIANAKREEIFRGLISDLRSQIPVKKNDENVEKFLKVGDEWLKKQQNPAPEHGATAAPAPGGTAAPKQPQQGMTGAAPAPNPPKTAPQPGATVEPQPGPAPAK